MAAGALALIADISIEEFARENDRIKYIRFKSKFWTREWHHCWVLNMPVGSAVMVMDGDLQHPPYLIPLFLELIMKAMILLVANELVKGNLL